MKLSPIFQAAHSPSHLSFAGYAALFDTRDGGGDIIRHGAFQRSLQKLKTPLQLCWQHRDHMVVGIVDSIAEDARGLRVIAHLHQPNGHAARRLREGHIHGLSFGYQARDYRSLGQTRELLEVDIFEVSLVSHPIQHAARVHLIR